MKKCPYCAEEIQDEAIKCKHCKEFLSVQTDRNKICADCGGQLRGDGEFCSNCGAMQPLEDASYINLSNDPYKYPYKKVNKSVEKYTAKKKFLIVLAALGALIVLVTADNWLSSPTSNKLMGIDLSKENLAWHAENTYGWDCPEVISKGKMTSGSYFYIECSSGMTLRVYPREGKHPKITNASGGYD